MVPTVRTLVRVPAALVTLLLAAGLASPASAGDRAPAPEFRCPIPAAAERERPATELRLALGRLLGEHAYLLMQTMRATAESAPDRTAIEDRLDANSEAIAGAIGGVYGADAGSEFAPLWQRHIDASAQYAAGVAAGDDAKVDEAQGELDAFRHDLDAFLQDANPKLDASDEAHAIQLHLDQLTAFAEGDYAAGYRAAREAYAHMFALGDSLARAIARQDPDTYPDERVAFSPASELRVTLDRLLGEHLVLAAEAMRASLDEAPNLPAARQALDANTADLAAAVEEVYGAEAGDAFEQIWTAHLTAYLDYIDAVRTGDRARIDAARATLEAYGQVFGEFIAGANPNLTADGVADLIAHHTAALLQMVDEYRAGSYPEAYATVGEAYEHMFAVGDALAAAISEQFPKAYDDLAELPRTDAVLAATGVGIAAILLGVVAASSGVLAAALAFAAVWSRAERARERGKPRW